MNVKMIEFQFFTVKGQTMEDDSPTLKKCRHCFFFFVAYEEWRRKPPKEDWDDGSSEQLER